MRCKTRYCNSTCQHDHWRRGHKQICKKIHRGGNAEQYYADKQYKEAVGVAVETCADDTKGQTCYICLEAVHPRTGEGLVRGCGCGDRDGVSSPELGVAHVSCLAEQAKILVEEAEENNFGNEAMQARWDQWDTCGLYKQRYYGVVAHALGWACWKTYVGRPEKDLCRHSSMTLLGNGLDNVGRHEDRLAILEAQLSISLRVWPNIEEDKLMCKHNMARCHLQTGRFEEAARLFRLVHARNKVLYETTNDVTLKSTQQLAHTLIALERYAEVKSLTLPLLRKVGPTDDHGLSIRQAYAMALYRTTGASRDELLEGAATLRDVLRRLRRIGGLSHPDTLEVLAELDRAGMTLEDYK